jgi:hypothetical protein
VLIVFSLHRELLKMILVDEPLPEVVLSHMLLGQSEVLKLIHVSNHLWCGTALGALAAVATS